MNNDTPETDSEAWFDNDEGWWVSRSVSRRMERGMNCALAQLFQLEKDLKTAQETIADQKRQLAACEAILDGINEERSEG